MRIITFILSSIFLLSAAFASSGSNLFYHNAPQGVIRGDQAKIEVMLTGANSQIYDFHLFYRELGDVDFKSITMEKEGMVFYASLNTSQFSSGLVQYYIGYEGALGETGTLPEEIPQLNPYQMSIAPAASMEQDLPLEIVILSPLPEEVIAEDELVVAASIFSEEEQVDYSNTRLVIDGVNIRSNIDFSEGVITFIPPANNQYRTGFHNVEIQVYNSEGRMLGKKEWSFRSTESVSISENSFVRGSAFVENRYQNIASISDNFFRAGGELSGKKNDLDYRARLVFSSEEEPIRQPVNRYTGTVRYNFSIDNNVFLHGGDFNPYFNPLVLQDKRIRGIHAGLAYGFFTFDYIWGQLYRGVDGRIDTLRSASSNLESLITIGGTYQRNLWAVRPGFRVGNNAWWTLNLINSKEDPKSIKYGSNAREAVSMGTDLNLTFDQKRIVIDASVNASINNTNAGLAEISYDTLAYYNPDLKENDEARQLWDMLSSTGWLSMTPGINPLPSMAMQFDASFRYFYNNLKVRYYRVDKNFASPGNPYLLKDVGGLHISDNIRMFKNQVYFTLFFKNYTTNRSSDKEATKNNELGATISYFPYATLPSLTVSYSTFSRSNDVTSSDSMLYREDNSTQRLSFNTSYTMNVSGTANTLTLNYTQYGRDDQINFASQSDFNLYGAGLRTKFSFPMTARLNYSKSENSIGDDRSAGTSSSSVGTFLLGLDYMISGFTSGDVFKPFIDYRMQQVETYSEYKSSASFPSTEIKTGRNNYTIGFAYQSPKLGILSLRYDHIAYDNSEYINYNDSIMNFRYSYNF
ncbi:MAG: hypothetical protein E4H13_03105 [Calditrichales bacterium]|nr:MAG: hypothetical protein E4H13_03105 [Calditrichales bacterium]